MEYRYGSHTVFNIEYHFVWVTKYRYKVLTGDVGQRILYLDISALAALWAMTSQAPGPRVGD